MNIHICAYFCKRLIFLHSTAEWLTVNTVLIMLSHEEEGGKKDSLQLKLKLFI